MLLVAFGPLITVKFWVAGESKSCTVGSGGGGGGAGGGLGGGVGVEATPEPVLPPPHPASDNAPRQSPIINLRFIAILPT